MATLCSLGHPPSLSCSECPGPTKYAPPAVHFNALGELIPYRLVPEARGVALVPAVHDIVKAVPSLSSPETDSDDDLELAYPDDEPSEPALPAPPPAGPTLSAPATTTAPPLIPLLPPPSFTSAPPASTRAPLPRRPPSSRVSVPRVSKEPVPLTSRLPAVPTPQPTAKPVVKTQHRNGRPPRTEAQAQADARRTLPRLSSPAQAVVPSARSHHAGMMLPPPVPPYALPGAPPRSMPPPLPMPPPRTVPTHLSMPPPPVPRIRCATPGCRGSVVAAGKRCMLCVKGSWLGRKDAWVMAQAQAGRDKEKERKKLMSKERKRAKALALQQWDTERARNPGETTPDAKTQRVTIKLKLPPRAKETASEDKGKGKAVEESVDENAASGVPEGDTKAKDKAAEEPEKPKGEETAIWDGAGWDSELSDLTNSDSDSESEAEEPPRPTLKIRIPARTPSSSPTKPSASAASGSGSAVAAASTLPTHASVSGTPEAPSEPQRLCTIARCRRPLPPLALYRWKCCSPCRKQYREYQRARLGRVALTNAAGSEPFPSAGPAGPNGALPPQPPALSAPVPRDQSLDRMAEIRAQKEWEREESRRALEVSCAPVAPRKLYREPYEKSKAAVVTWSDALTSKSQRPMEGARVCTGRGCEHIIPSEVEYDSTMCGGCRGHERRMAERVLVKEGKLPAPPSGATYDPKDDLPVLEAKPGRCMYADCGILISADTDVSERACEQCVRRRNAVQRRLPGRPPGARNKPKTAADEKPSGAQNPLKVSLEKPLAPPKKRKRTSPYPPYQSCEALLKDFGARFRGFIEAQSFYFLLRAGMGPQPPPEAMFDFSGEYSVVATDLDVVARKAELEVGVHDVKDAVARAGGLDFSPTSWVSILSKPDGVVTRFACVHLVQVFLPISMPPGHPQTPSHTKSMQGELEVAILPDDSHKYFPGEKTIVRFRLVG